MTGLLLLTNATVPDATGGLERYVRELATAMAPRAGPVTLVAKRVDDAAPARETAADGVTVERIRVPRKRNPLFALLYPAYVAAGVLAALFRHRGAVVHAHFVVPALPLAVLPRRLARPYAYTFHAPVHRELLSERQGSYLLPRAVQRVAVAALRAAERRVVDRAAEVVVLSDFMRGQLAELSPGAAARAILVPGGVDTTWFTPGPAAADDWADGAGGLVVSARRLTPRTGVIELIEAMSEGVAARPAARLAVLGEGALRAAAELEIRRRGLDGKVRLLGRVGDPELRDWYRRADVAVTPTQELEGFGLATAEAMACGAAPLVTPVGANPEVVRGLDHGCVTDGPTPADLARALVHRLDRLDPGRRYDLRVTCREAAMTWSWDAVADRHDRLYVRVRDGRPSG